VRTSRRSKLVVLIALVAAALPLVAGPALADDFAPEIKSFSRTSEGLLGGHQIVTIEFTATDEGPAGLAYAYFTFTDPLGGFLRVDSEWMNRAPEGTFTATKVLSPWVGSGEYRLVEVEVSDREWNSTTYERDAAPGFDFAAADFTVENPNEDVTAPTLRSARLFQTHVRQGTPVVALYDAADDLSGVKEVAFFGWSPTRAQYTLHSLPELGAVGPAVWLVPLAAASGAYDSMGIMVMDRAGNSIWYQEGQEARAYPPRAELPAHDEPDPGSLDFTVVGETGDRLSPSMTSFSRATPQVRHIGDVVGLDYSAFDPGTGIEQVAAQWTGADGRVIDASKTCGDLTRGPVSVQIEDYRSVDSEWQLASITFADYLWNHTTYLRDGRILYSNADPGPETHSYDLSQGDFRIEAGPPGEQQIHNSSASYCYRNGNVSLDLDDVDVLYGEVVTTAGTVLGGGGAVEQPVVAVHQYLASGPRLVGVVEGTARGRFEESFVARQSGQVTATFFGVAGPNGADAATSPRVSYKVRPRVRATLGDERIRSGGTTRVRGRVVPSAGGGAVLLQQRGDDRWQTVDETAIGPKGGFSFAVRPRGTGTFAYRVVKQASEKLAAGRSPVRTLEVYGP
jgi:hypothetical protein